MVTFSPHIALDVPSRSSAVEFYQSMLSMELIEEKTGETVLSCGDIEFHIQEANEPAVYLEFSVENCEIMAQKLKRSGCNISEVKTPEGATSYIVEDPFGIKYHVHDVFEGEKSNNSESRG